MCVVRAFYGVRVTIGQHLSIYISTVAIPHVILHIHLLKLCVLRKNGAIERNIFLALCGHRARYQCCIDGDSSNAFPHIYTHHRCARDATHGATISVRSLSLFLSHSLGILQYWWRPVAPPDTARKRNLNGKALRFFFLLHQFERCVFLRDEFRAHSIKHNWMYEIERRHQKYKKKKTNRFCTAKDHWSFTKDASHQPAFSPGRSWALTSALRSLLKSSSVNEWPVVLGREWVRHPHTRAQWDRACALFFFTLDFELHS